MMIRSLLLANLLLALFASVKATKEEEHEALDTNRVAAEFTAGTRKSGFTYIDTMDMEMNQHVELGGQQLDITSNVHMENEVIVEDIVSGGKSIDTTTKRIKFASSSGMGHPLVCDSLSPSLQSQEFICQDIFKLVGTSSHFVVDDQGVVAEGTEEASKESPLAKVGPSQQLEQTSRLLQYIPFHPIEPGESWDASADLGELGSFSGTAKLLGYKDHEGYDCAMISVSGSLHIDAQVIADQLKQTGFGGAVKGLSISDAAMTTLILWDNEMQLVRWSEQTASYTVGMDSPFGGAKMNIPVEQVAITSSKVKASR